jgi:hypothetical protein
MRRLTALLASLFLTCVVLGCGGDKMDENTIKETQDFHKKLEQEKAQLGKNTKSKSRR